MKYQAEYREPAAVQAYAQRICQRVTRSWVLMEVCGGQTHSIMKYGLDQLLPPEVELLHGPGCPVCVTPLESLDRAMAIASHPEVIFCSFGDMLRVPGSTSDLRQVQAAGGQVRVVYSPLDAVKIAQAQPDKEVVFFGVGFETTAPANAMAVYQAMQLGLNNFSLLVSQVLVPPALRAILAEPHCRVQGFLAAGHVCTIMGLSAYEALVAEYQIPIVVTGFEPLDILQGVDLCLEALEAGQPALLNQYSRVVRAEGNLAAQHILTEVFEVIDLPWRGIGMIPQSGLGLREKYRAYDAADRFALQQVQTQEPAECLSGQVLQGQIKPPQCPAFGQACTPETPLGATMVSSEGACAAYYRYRGVNHGL